MDAGDGDGMCLPQDVLLDVLRRLPGGAVAACKCVCRAWRATIDAHDHLSLERYFPRRAFPGMFVSKVGCRSSCEFFAPSTRRRRLYYQRKTEVRQSCNGLLLLADWGGYGVLNPATSRHALLPSWTSSWRMDRHLMSLAFDPALSLHYHVFLFHKFEESSSPARPEEDDEVPPPPEQPQEEGAKLEPKEKVMPMLVYSSSTDQWEKRSFTPGRCAPEHLYDLVARPSGDDGAFWSSQYRRGSLYVHCHNNVLMILRHSKGTTYDMAPLPQEDLAPKSHLSLPRTSLLSSYERGIHYVGIDGLQLRVWLLIESEDDGQLGWTLAYDANLNPHGHMIHPLAVTPKVPWGIVGSSGGPVSLTEDCYTDDDEEEEEEDLDGSEYSWNSDEDNFIDAVGDAAHPGPPAWGGYGRIVGFHPHKNAIILLIHSAVVVYHLDTSRMQYLGDEGELTNDYEQQACCVDDVFTYRPCYEDVLPAGKSSSQNNNR